MLCVQLRSPSFLLVSLFERYAALLLPNFLTFEGYSSDLSGSQLQGLGEWQLWSCM